MLPIVLCLFCFETFAHFIVKKTYLKSNLLNK